MKTNASLLTLIVFLTLTCVFVSGCKDDDDNDTNGSIEGKWKGTNAKASVIVFGYVVQEEEDDSFDADVEFKSNQTLEVSNDGVNDTGTWSRNGNSLTVSADLNIPYLKDTETLSIETLTATSLELYIEKDTTYTDPDSNTSITGTLTGTLYFERVSD